MLWRRDRDPSRRVASMSRSEQAERIIITFEKINIWHRRNEHAPHKPLLLLLALARLLKGNPRLEEFRSYEEVMRNLLAKYSPARRSIHPEYPFWRLQGDGLWEVVPKDGLRVRKSNKDPLKSELLERKVRGGFTEQVWLALKDDPNLVKEIARLLVRTHFPETLASSVFLDVGLSSEISM
jgi:putative restriction endonuclease